MTEPKPKTCRCFYCGDRFPTFAKLDKHMEEKHLSHMRLEAKDGTQSDKG